MQNGDNDQAVTVDSRDMWIMGFALLMLIGTMALLVTNLVILGSNQRQLQVQAVQAKQVQVGVCAFRHSLVDQYHTGEKYLLKHPNGVPALGLSAAQIQQGIDRQKAAASSLAGLDCGSSE